MKELYTWYRKHPKWHAQMEQLLAANHLKRPHDQLSEEVARKLYGTILENSVTRLENSLPVLMRISLLMDEVGRAYSLWI